MKNTYHLSKPIGILGVGSFGTVLANLMATRHRVIVYARKQSTINVINQNRLHRNINIHPNISATDQIKLIADSCDIIIPVVPSYAFRDVILQISPFLTSNHLMIHATKGFSVSKNLDDHDIVISPRDIMTMSELIVKETPVYRVGCLSGPNLSKEIAEGHPAATVIASKFDEVIKIGTQIFHSNQFQVFGSHDIKGIELAGIFKNYIAIAAGASAGLGMGENVKALLITRGIAEMILVGKYLGVDSKSFLGLAGIGDLVATCNSPLSRNYSVGFKLAKGVQLKQIIDEMTEAAEGLNTIKVIKYLSDSLKFPAPLVQILYKTVYEGFPFERGVKLLMRLNAGNDVEF